MPGRIENGKSGGIDTVEKVYGRVPPPGASPMPWMGAVSSPASKRGSIIARLHVSSVAPETQMDPSRKSMTTTRPPGRRASEMG